MKQKSVKDLYLVKQILLNGTTVTNDSIIGKAIQLINSVLLDEGGTKAVLYPYNSLEETILQLWGECMKVEDIAIKTGVDVDIVQCVVENQANYEEDVDAGRVHMSRRTAS